MMLLFFYFKYFNDVWYMVFNLEIIKFARLIYAFQLWVIFIPVLHYWARN